MDTTSQVEHAHRNTVPLWLKISLIGLLIEKFIQHTVVSLAFFFDWFLACRVQSARSCRAPALCLALSSTA
jgi:hypothetical protein